MHLEEIQLIAGMNSGAPMPILIMDDFRNLNTLFYCDTPSEVLHQRNTIYDKGITLIKFLAVYQYKFGMPGNETLSGHPYYGLGLRSNRFYEMKDSNWISELMKIASVHSNFNRDKWKNTRHFIITFHDEMLECIANDYEMYEEQDSIKNRALEIMNSVFTDDI